MIFRNIGVVMQKMGRFRTNSCFAVQKQSERTACNNVLAFTCRDIY